VSGPTIPPPGVHALIEHLIETPADRALVRTQPDELFDRFQIPAEVREDLRGGGRDDLHRLGIHPNFVIKWLIWSGRPTMPFFPIDYYFARR
jgi:2'-aminobiphenyl-2,3-diol 1,2-dioxygenase, small subunit